MFWPGAGPEPTFGAPDADAAVACCAGLGAVARGVCGSGLRAMRFDGWRLGDGRGACTVIGGSISDLAVAAGGAASDPDWAKAVSADCRSGSASTQNPNLRNRLDTSWPHHTDRRAVTCDLCKVVHGPAADVKAAYTS